MPLTDPQCRNAEKQEKDYKLADGGGLYLYVTSKGAKSWRLKYRFAGKEKRLVFGRYPELKLADARIRRDDARRLLRDHKDPAAEEHKRKMAAYGSAGATMEKIGRQWHEAQKPRWSPKYATKLIQALERDVFPVLGALHLADIDGPMILHMLRKVEAAFLTIMNERLDDTSRDADIRILDMMLAHKSKGVSGSESAYNRAKFSARRRRFAEQWAGLMSEGLAQPNGLIDGRARDRSVSLSWNPIIEWIGDQARTSD